ncbi:LamG-like jellyroll fold domain-containing protein, partial [Psychroserpens sp.]|uniref:LamG-like jellyroll fold domain-containing protein n=1 Tax=Psychroserpens sp. TaxID=2020870 RepID=UPI002B2718DD
LSLDQTSFDCNDIGNNTVTLTVTDNNGNVSTCTAIVDVQDTTNPTIPTLPIITGQCSATVPTPTITDICSGTITGTTSDVLVYTTQGSFAITWNFDDGNGNSINVVQNVVINDTIDPTPLCQDITIQLDDTTGTATITGAQIDNGSTDNCGSVNFTLSQSTFDCTNIGSNIIVLTVDDGNGNSAICTSNVTVTSPNITGGTVLGYLNNNQTIADEDNLVEVTACPDEPQNATINLYGHTGNVAYWEYSLNGGLTWTTVANTSTTYYYPNILETTLVRAVIQIGSCQANSSIAYVVVIPPDVPPTIIGPNTFTTCLGEDITVEAESSFGVNPDFNNGGMFNEANLNNLGWTVDGAAEMSAGGNNTSNTYWKLTNGPKKFNGRCFDSPDGNKFAVVSGIPPYDNPDHTITPLSTLETSTFNTLGLASALLEFDQAYFLEAGAWLLIELSLDGGATYPITLDPGAAYDYTGPSDTGFVNGQSLGFGGQCRNSQGTLVDNHVIVDLQNYIGLTNLRIKFTYSGTSNSVWALENITIPQAPVDEVIEWEDGTGTVVTTGSITTISPVTPGIQTYGVTSLINGCRADGDEGTEFISVDASLAYAGENITQLIGECGEEVSLNAYDNDLTAAQNISNGVSNPAVFTTGTYPGTQEAGVWSATSISGCGSNYVFSDISSPRTKFSAEPGTYELTWSIPSVGCSDTIEVTIESCPTIDFDGNNDYITFENNYNLSNQFSIEAWIKPESISGTQTIFSKRNANDLSTGYDLRLVGNIIQFTWNASGVIQSSYPLTTDRWFHIAVVNSSGTYRLYVDGIEVSNPIGGSAPSVNTMKSLIGGMDQIGNASSRPVNYYDGWVDELRIWNKALSTAQIRQMMNQEIYNNTAVRGEIVPLDIAGLTWANLDGYYQMDVNCGYLSANAGNIRGQLRNMNSIQPDSAPLPYTSRVNGQEWNTDNTWTNFNVWDAPNSIGIDGITPIDWNIVQTSHHIESGNKDITVLGLISDTANKELKISDPSTTQDETNDGQALRVTHYLELDGSINLVGESQLIQDEGSILDQDSGGFLERDQQGTASSFHYNYWSSSVNPTTSSGIGQRGSGIPSTNANYSVNEILFDGTNVNAASAINFQTPFTAADGPITSPITVSSYWMFTFNGTNNDYYAWSSINANSSLVPGEGYTMKGVSGTEAIATPQNYVFRGKPNNGDISLNVGSGNNRLIGNPYASSIDAYEFILDNTNENGGRAPTNIINGALYFWDHFSGGTHLLEEYVGGYATYTRMGGVKAISNDIRINNNNAIGTKEPSRYIALNQGFFVSTALDPSISGTTASVTGGNVTFKNSQRIFKTEGSGQSVMFRNANTVDNSDEDQREKLRLMFDSPSGYHRQLLVGVELGTSLGFDLGFDAPIIDINDEDMFWNFNDTKYVIQAIDNFDSEQILPLGLIVNQEGICTIKIDELENISDDKTIFIFDQELGVYHNLRTSDFEVNLAIGDYFNRFFVTFSSEDTLSTSEEIQSQTIINYLNASHEIYVKTNNVSEVKKISLINILGQEIQIWNRPANYIVDSSIRIPVKQLSEGTYIIKVQTNNSTFNSKVVIKH